MRIVGDVAATRERARSSRLVDPSLDLSADEQAEMERRAPAQRPAYAAAHRLARGCVADLAGVDARHVDIRQSCEDCSRPHGRPVVVWPAGYHVSWSHTDDHVIAAASTAPIAADIESSAHASLDELLPVAAGFPLDERRDVDAHVDPVARVLELWTRKECLVKLGARDLDSALSTDVRSDAVSLASGVWSMVTEHGPGWIATVAHAGAQIEVVRVLP